MSDPLKIGPWRIQGMLTIKYDAPLACMPEWFRQMVEDEGCSNCNLDCALSEAERTFYYALDSAGGPTLILHESDPRRGNDMWMADDDHYGWYLRNEWVELHLFSPEDIVSAAETDDPVVIGDTFTCYSCEKEGDAVNVEFLYDRTYCTECTGSCYDCDDGIDLVDDLHQTQIGVWSLGTHKMVDIYLCDDHWHLCYYGSCEEGGRSEDMYYVWDEYYCEDHTSSCSVCDNTVPYGEEFCSDDCRSENCDCQEWGTTFSIRNDGNDPLPNDTKTLVSLPAGEISPEGIDEIRCYVQSYAYNKSVEKAGDPEVITAMKNLRMASFNLEMLGSLWQTKEGNYTKRLSRFCYKQYHLKVPLEVISQIGCIASDHSRSVEFEIDVTRHLNEPPDMFAHDDSCWWQSYSSSRCALKTNGGFGLRAWTGNDWPEGRAWVMPLKVGRVKQLVPTFESLEPDAFVVFNGYGNLSGYTPARIMAHLAGMTYRKINFGAAPMYINSDSGYLVAPEEIAKDYTDGSLHLSLITHASLFENEQVSAAETEKENEYV